MAHQSRTITLTLTEGQIQILIHALENHGAPIYDVKVQDRDINVLCLLHDAINGAS